MLIRKYSSICNSKTELIVRTIMKKTSLKPKHNGRRDVAKVSDSENGTKKSFEVLPTPVKSPSDDKEYRVIKLQNGLTACLIADTTPLDYSSDSSEDSESDGSNSELEPESSDTDALAESDDDMDDAPMKKVPEVEQKMAAAALCVGVGSFSDPKDIPGLAHFLEHMVFMGSAKYPEENDFDSFIKKKGGSDNASTDCETTVFYFECLEKHLLKALDKFAQFFISPLMKESAMTREREAMESEFQIALPKDSYRKEQLLCSLANPESPANSFAWGNLITLRDRVTDEKLYADVHAFRKRHYSAHRMTVAIQARLSLEELEAYVLECFSDVPNNQQPPEDFRIFQNNVFNTPEFTRMYFIKPQKDVCQLDLTWCFPSLLDKYKTKPHQYVGWFVGDEGKGSLLSFLKKKVWALAIYTGNGETGIEHNSLYSLFSISLVLTKEGLSHLKEVITSIFSYLNMLKNIGPQERLFKELQTIEDISFRFSAEESPMDYVEEISEAMHFYEPEDFLTGSDLYFEYDPESISSVLKELVPNKMNIAVTSSFHEEEIIYDKKEEWFGTPYTVKEIPSDWISLWDKAEPEPEMCLPLSNEFLTTDFTILPRDENHPEYPEKVLETALCEVWYRKDQKFKLPTAHYNFYMINPLAVESALSQCKLDILINIFNVQIAESIHPALVAELSYSLNTNDKGIVLQISGYNQKLPILVNLVGEKLKMFTSELTPNIFLAVREKLSHGYFNKLINPSSLTKDLRLSLLIEKYYTATEKYDIVKQITFEDVKEFCNAFFKTLFVKVLIQGNVDKDTALEVVHTFTGLLGCEPLKKEFYPKFRVLEVPKGQTYCRVESLNTNDSNSYVTNYYQVGPFNLKDSVTLELLMMIIEEPLFDVLRTKEQLGYKIFCTLRDTFGILGYTITVNAQATKNTTTYVNERIENFIKTTNRTLKKMSSKNFNQIKRDLIKTKQCSDVVLSEEVSRNWSEILSEDYMFDRSKNEIAAIETVKQNDLKQFWENINILGNATHRKLSIQVVGFNINSEIKNSQESEKIPEKSENEGKKPVLTFLESDENMKKLDNYFITDLADFRKLMKYYPVSPNQLK